MARWDPPPPRFPNDPSRDGSGPGWYLPRRPFDADPCDHEGPAGSGLALPMVGGTPARSHCWKVGKGTALLLVGIALPVLAGVLEASETGRADDSLATGGLVFLALFLAIIPGGFGAILLGEGVRGLRRGQSAAPKVLLTVDGVVLTWRGMSQRVPWDALGSARFGWTREHDGDEEDREIQPYFALRNWLSFGLDSAAMERHLGHDEVATELRIPVDELACNPVLAVRLIEFYRDHPEERAELRTVAWQDRAAGIARGLPESTS